MPARTSGNGVPGPTDLAGRIVTASRGLSPREQGQEVPPTQLDPSFRRVQPESEPNSQRTPTPP